MQIPVAVARSPSVGVAIRYVLPVLWKTSRLAVLGVDGKRHCDTGAESDVYECLVVCCVLGTASSVGLIVGLVIVFIVLIIIVVAVVVVVLRRRRLFPSRCHSLLLLSSFSFFLFNDICCWVGVYSRFACR